MQNKEDLELPVDACLTAEDMTGTREPRGECILAKNSPPAYVTPERKTFSPPCKEKQKAKTNLTPAPPPLFACPRGQARAALHFDLVTNALPCLSSCLRRPTRAVPDTYLTNAPPLHVSGSRVVGSGASSPASSTTSSSTLPR